MSPLSLNDSLWETAQANVHLRTRAARASALPADPSSQPDSSPHCASQGCGPCGSQAAATRHAGTLVNALGLSEV